MISPVSPVKNRPTPQSCSKLLPDAALRSSLGSHRKLIGGNEPGSNSRGHSRSKKGKGRGRWVRGKGWLRGKSCVQGGAKELAKPGKKDSGKSSDDTRAEKVPQFKDTPPLDHKVDTDTSLKDEQLVDDKEDNCQGGETKRSEDSTEEINDSSVGEEIACDTPEEVKNKVENMEVTAQNGDQKNKLLEMMSRQFNSANIPEGSVPLDSKKNPRLPRLTRKRKSEVLDSADKTNESSLSQQTSVSVVSTLSNNPITSALKKVRKENLENPHAPSPSPTAGRTRRSGQDMKSGSEKDPNEETTSISENLEVEAKTEETPSIERNIPSNRGKKKGRGRGKLLMEGGDIGIDSGTESPITPSKGRGKVRTGSEEDYQNTSIESPTPSSVGKGRGRGKGFGENESSTPVGRGKVRGKGVIKDEPLSDNKGRGKQKAEREKSEEPLSTITTPGAGKGRGRGRVLNEEGGNSLVSNSPVGGVGRRGRGKNEVDKEGVSETELGGRQRRSITPLRSDVPSQSEPKRSQRLSLPRDGSQDPPLSSKRGKQKAGPEVLKKQETVAVTKAYPSRGKKEEIETGLTKTRKKKKKHFKGLSYSFSTKKKKGKGKLSIGRPSFDATLETDSVVSEEIDIESMDSSSQDVPSEQLSFRDQDGIEDGLSEGADNDDIDMDSMEASNADGEAEDEQLDDLRTENASTNPVQDLGDAEEDMPADGESSNGIDLDEEQAPVGVTGNNTIDGATLGKDCNEYVSAMFDEDKVADGKIMEEFSEEKSSMNFTVHEKSLEIAVCKESAETVAGTREDTTFQDTISGIVSFEGSSNMDIPNETVFVGKTLHVEPTDNVSVVEGSSSADVADTGSHKDESVNVNRTLKGSAAVSPVTYELMDDSVQQDVYAKPTQEKLAYLSQYSSNMLSVAADPLLEYSATPGADEVLPEEGATISVEENGRESSAAQQSCDKPKLVAVEDVAVMDNRMENVPLPSRCDAKSEIGNTSTQESLLKTEFLSHSVRDPLSNDSAIRHLGRRRHSVSKRRLDDLGFEGHNSDSSDSLSEVRPPGEGVRKSKRLSRNSSPHPLAIAAPRSPEGAGKGQSKPIGTQSACVTPVSPEECHRFILSTPVTLTQSCQQQGIDQSAAPSLTNVLCKCRIKENPVAVGITGDVYCQAVDSFDGRMIGCCNVVANHRYLRVSGKIPFMLLCDIHRQRLRRHNCCPCCGLFCTQGIFYECSWDKAGSRHYYHKLCGLILAGTTLCPHCGSEESPKEVQLELKLNRKPVVYLKQHQERKEALARMTWSKKSVPGVLDQTTETVPDNEISLELRNGRVISAHKLPLGLGREKVQDALRSIRNGKTVNVKPSPKGVYWACKQNDLEKLLHVLVHGLNPNVKVKEYGNQTGMHVAAAFGNLAALHILALAGATIDMTDTQLMTPLMVAITKEQNSIVHYLIQAGASLMAKTQDGMTCLHLAAKCGNFVACQHILDSGRLTRHAVNMQDEGGWTPLVWASENKFINVVKFLLDRGGNPQLCDVEQNTALHWAAFSGSTYICSMVLDRGCSLRSMNAHGDTPLHIAARQNHTDAVVLLLARGARLDVLNTKGQTPIDCAQPDTDVYLQLTLNNELLDVMKQNNIRTEKILSSDIAAGKEEVPIPCVNGVDDDLLPRDYLYIAENCEASNVIIDRTITSLKWCECEDGCNADHCGCGQLNFQCWYDPDGRLLPDFNYADPPMIFECNRACRCNKLSCNNRVVQHGISAHMQLFKTSGKGWGVRALKTIQKGSYVCEYVGEIITDLEADQRRDDSYLFDLDNKDSETFCIDARAYGNIARFINHLCEANLTPVKVFIDHQDLTFPRIAFFANRDIEADEELGFDYGEKFWIIKYKHFTCTCGSEKCKYSSETIHTTLENYNKKIREMQEMM